MSDRPLKLLLIDSDPIFRLGLRQTLEEFPELQVVAEADTYTSALQILAELAQQDPNLVNLVVLEPDNNRSANRQEFGLQIIRQLKKQYPNLPILLLCHILQPGMLAALKAEGVNGYCPKGTPVSELIIAMQQIAAGNFYWVHQTLQLKEYVGEIIGEPSLLKRNQKSLINKLRSNLRASGSRYIQPSLTEVTKQLQIPGLTVLNKAILAGRRRELIAAQWLLDNLADILPEEQQTNSNHEEYFPELPLPKSENSTLTITNPTTNPLSPPLLSPRALQATLFATCINKLQFGLQNVTDIPLEIDILREDKKRELLYLLLQKFADSLDELRTSEVKLNSLNQINNILLADVWEAATKEFFGKFSRIKTGDIEVEIVEILLQDAEIVKTEIINKIVLTTELLSYLIYQTDLYIDNTSYAAASYEANEHAGMILENMLISLANAVMQPLLNRLANVEVIKKDYYNRQLISTREIERFRNNLSWKYRWHNYVGAAQEIFESRHELLVLAPRGIAKVFVYASRNDELSQLGGIPLVVTLLLEFRDAATPRIQSLVSFLGNGVVFVLTRIVGRGVGLIVRGVLQGIGSASLPERKRGGRE
jgi:DNA-binding NarL/FixJ family response regulator